MSDQFIQGEDGLARLLREALPCFDAPAEMETRFKASMAEMQASRIAAESLVFEAPSSQATAFARLMADIQTAQEPRRDAVIKKIQAGESAQVVLGAELSAEGHAWLAQQSLSKKAPAPVEEPHAWHVPTWLWGGFGFAFVSVFAVSLVMKMGVFSFGHPQEMAADKPATVQLAVLEQKVMSAPAAVVQAPAEEMARSEPAAKENYAPAMDAAPKPQLQARAEVSMEKAAKIAASSEAKKEREADLSEKKVIGELAMNEIQPAAVAAAPPPPMAAAPAPVAVMSAPMPVAGLMADQASAERAKGVVAASKRARLAKPTSSQSFSLQQSPVEAAKQALAGKDGASSLIVKMANPATPEAAAWLVGFQNAVKAESHDGVRSVQVETDANLPAEQVSVVVNPLE